VNLSMRTINLLPKPRQQELRFESLLQRLWLMVILSFLSFAVVFICQLGAKFYLQNKAKSITAEISQLKSQVNKGEDGVVNSQIQQANNTIGDFNNLADAAPKWSKVIKAFTVLP